MFLEYLYGDQTVHSVLPAVSSAYAAHNSFTFKIVKRVSDGAIDLGQEKIVRHTIRSVTEVKSNQFW